MSLAKIYQVGANQQCVYIPVMNSRQLAKRAVPF